jgi:Papain fold toxin 1, glutamine deamidase
MNDWAGEAAQPATMDQVSDRLTELGPGSSAVVRCNWSPRGGHYFNAINDGGDIKAVDGQKGEVEPWPPSTGGVGYDESYMVRPHAIFFDAKGKVVK